VPLRTVALERSVLLIGPPGIGKSGLLGGLVAELVDVGVDVVAIRAEDLVASSGDELRRELGLTHPLADVAVNWPGPPAILVIDGLDAARGADATHTLVALIEEITASSSRWRVLASVRTFDRRHNHVLRAAFRGPPAAGFTDPELVALSHFAVAELSDAELAGLRIAAPALGDLVDRVNPDFRALLGDPFNLSLLADLATRLPAERLTDVHTRLELLALHWATVVVSPPEERERRETALRALCAAAVSTMSLQVSRDAVLDGTGRDEAGVLGLLRTGVLVEHSPLSVFGQPKLGFSHNVLFDYALAHFGPRGGTGRARSPVGGRTGPAVARPPEFGHAPRGPVGAPRRRDRLLGARPAASSWPTPRA
jgi:hypothetical protein